MSLGQLFKSFFRSKVDVFARFEILREAVSGTMSKFYKARDRQTDEIVGLKILDPVKTAQLQARFKGLVKPSEGEIASRFDHPNLMKTLEFGLTTRNEQYLVMEFIDGPGMNSLIVARNEEVKPTRLELIRQAARALQVVHDTGFIHRDICPRNFVVSTDLTSLKLIDFGLTVPRQREFMLPGNRTGTPAYMSPEVVRRKPTDHRLDIFSFGVTAYELLTFELPWQGGTDGQAAMAHGSVEPIPITQLRPNLDPALARTVMSCLEVDPVKRPQSLTDFLSAIRHVEHEEVEPSAGPSAS